MTWKVKTGKLYLIGNYQKEYNMQEVWKVVNGFEDYYEVSNLGNIRTSYGTLLKPFVNNKGYKCTKFQVNNHITNILVHRLVAKHFVDNPFNYPCVDHLDSNRQNNVFTNLEWVTHKENMQRASQRGSFKNQKNRLGHKLSRSTSKYHGVSYDKSRNAWIGMIILDRKTVYRRRFKTEEEAARHVNWTIDTLGLTDRKRNDV